jgi:hypothetical protein
MKNNKNNTEPCNYTNTMLGAVSESGTITEDIVNQFSKQSVDYMKKVMSGEIKPSKDDDIKGRQELIKQLETEKNSPDCNLSAINKLQDICKLQIDYLSGRTDMSISPNSPTIEEVLSQSFDPNSNF